MILKLFLIYQIFPQTGIFGENSYQCVDCRGDHVADHCDDVENRKYHKHDCVIETRSGYSCGQYKFSGARSSRSDWTTPNPTDDMSKCIPNDLNITEPNIEICCVWSKELGCQILVKPGNDYTCGTCRESRNEYDNLKTCPCSRGSFIPYSSAVKRISLHILYALIAEFLWKLRV